MIKPKRFRSRRNSVAGSLGAPFVPWTGNNFLQQTNFTGFIAPYAEAENFTTPVIVTPEWEAMLLVPAVGDILVVEALIGVQNADGADPYNLRIGLKSSTGADSAIDPIEIPANGYQVTRVRWMVPMRADDERADTVEWTSVGDAGPISGIGEPWAFKLSDIQTMWLYVDIAAPTNFFELDWAYFTRVRAGL